jgi:hypothetical protein
MPWSIGAFCRQRPLAIFDVTGFQTVAQMYFDPVAWKDFYSEIPHRR